LLKKTTRPDTGKASAEPEKIDEKKKNLPPSLTDQTPIINIDFSKLDVYGTLPEQSDDVILKKLAEKKDSLIADISYRAVQSKALFSIQTSGETEFLLVPKNFNQLLENSTWRIIMAIITHLGKALKLSDAELLISSTTEDQKLFWGGVMNRVIHGPLGTMKTLSFAPGGDMTALGRCCFDAEAVLLFSGVVGAYNYLPETIKYGLSKQKKLTAEINRLAGPGSSSILGQLPQRIEDVIRLKISEKKSVYKPLVDSYLLSYNQVTSDLVRRKSTGKKGEAPKPIKLQRLSDRVECILEFDEIYLKRYEGPWDDLKKLSEKYNQGAKLSEVETVRDAYKKAYNKQFEISDKLNSWSANRRQLIAAFKGKGARRVAYTKKQNQDCINFACEQLLDQKGDSRLFDALSPHHLLASMGENENWTKYTRNVQMKNIDGLYKKVEKLLDEADFKKFDAWVVGLNYEPILTRYNPDFFSDNSEEKKEENEES